MGHTPNAMAGNNLLTDFKEEILKQLRAQSDIAMARAAEDRDGTMIAIRKRHANELKAAKRNHKHRAKRIKNRMKEFENLSPTEFSARFKDGVQSDQFDFHGGTVSGRFIYDLEVGIDRGDLKEINMREDMRRFLTLSAPKNILRSGNPFFTAPKS